MNQGGKTLGLFREVFKRAVVDRMAGVSPLQSYRDIRADFNGFNSGAAVGLVIGLMIAIVIFAAIIGTVAYQLSQAEANTSVKANSTAAALLPLILTMFVIAGVVLPVGAVLVLLREQGTI